MKELKWSNRVSWAFISVFIMTFCSMDTLLFGTNANDIWRIYLVGALLCYEVGMLIHYFYTKKRSLHFRKELMVTTAVYFILISFTQVSAFCRGSYAMEIHYFYQMIIFAIVVTTVHLVSKEQFVDVFVDLMCIFAVIAICLFVLDKVGIIYSLPSYRMVNTSGYLYYHFGLGAVAAPREYVAARVYGIFREPGVFAIYMCVAFYFEMFFKRRMELKRLVVLSIAVLLSYSTAGYIALGLYFILYCVLKPAKSTNERYGKILLIIGGTIVIIFGISDEVQKEVFGKLFVENDSLNSRVYSIIGGAAYSLQYPILGQGWMRVMNDFENFLSTTYGLSSLAFTNTYIRMACTYGWIFTVISLCGVWRFHKRFIEKNGIVWLLGLCWIIVFSNENFVSNPLIYIITYYGYDNSSKKLTYQ